MKETLFFKQAELMLQVLPFFKEEKVFALKGGTAINFFHRNLPRLSVDIDLTYLPINERENALVDISQKLEQVSKRIKKLLPDSEIVNKVLSGTHQTIGFLLKRGNVSVKIEPNLVVRGTVYPVENRQLCQSAEEQFELTFSVQTLSFADLYGSKLCAALDRQHPRDFYDVNLLLKHEGITEKVRKSFLVYLISHPRPIVELLDPNPQDMSQAYHQEFKGMTFEQVALQELADTQNYLRENIKNILTKAEKRFLLSFKSLKPDWDLLGLHNIDQLPAVKWKLINLRRMSKTKHQIALEKLTSYLNE